VWRTSSKANEYDSCSATNAAALRSTNSPVGTPATSAVRTFFSELSSVPVARQTG